MPMASAASQMGGNVRVGLKDSLFISRGELAKYNAEQVKRIRRIIEGLGCEVASPDEAREMLDRLIKSLAPYLPLKIIQ